MARLREDIFFDKRRNVWVGRFWRLKEPGKRPPTKDLIEDHALLDREDLYKIFNKAEKDLIQSNFGDRNAEPVMFSETADQWLLTLKDALAPRTIVEYKRAIKRWIQINGNHSLTYFNSEANANFIKARLNDGASDATIQKDQRSLQVFANWLLHEGVIEKQIYIRKRRVEAKEPEIYSEKDLERLEQLLKNEGNLDWMRIYWLARFAVLRAGEIWALKLKKIDLERRTIEIADVPELDWTVKTRQRRKVAIGKNLLPLLKRDIRSRKPEERWFLDDGRGNPIYASSWALTQIFRRRCKELGIHGPKPLHGIRSAGITKMLLDSGGRAELVAAMAGHSVAVMLRHYARITDKEARGVADLL